MVQWSTGPIWYGPCVTKWPEGGPVIYVMHTRCMEYSKKLEGFKGGGQPKQGWCPGHESREFSPKWPHHRSKTISRQLWGEAVQKKVWTHTDVYRLYRHWAWFQPIPKLGFFWNQQWILCGFHLSTGDDFMDVPWQQIERVPCGNLLHSELENGHLVRWFTNWKWWFSIVMLVYQRVVITKKTRTKKSENVVGGPVFGAHPSSNRPVGRQHFLQRLRTCSANYLTSTSQIGENYLELYQPHPLGT